MRSGPRIAVGASALLLGLTLPGLAHASPGEPMREPPPPPAVVAPPPPQPVEVDPANYRMVLAGDILIGLSGGAMVAMAVGLGIRADAVSQRQALTVGPDPNLDAIARQDRRIRTGTITAITGGATAGALLVAGITLVAVGYRRERLRRMSLPALLPGRDGVQLSWQLRF